MKTSGDGAGSDDHGDRGDAAMERYAAGDDAAFADVYDEVAPRLMAYVVREMADRAAAEDVTQDTLLRIHRARGEFRRGARVMPWAYTIARNLVLDRRRRRCRDARLWSEGLAANAEPRCDFAADESLMAAETASSLRDAFAALPATQRTVLRMLRDDRLPLAQVASTLGTTIVAVKLRLHRALKALRAAAGGTSWRPK